LTHPDKSGDHSELPTVKIRIQEISEEYRTMEETLVAKSSVLQGTI